MERAPSQISVDVVAQADAELVGGVVVDDGITRGLRHARRRDSRHLTRVDLAHVDVAIAEIELPGAGDVLHVLHAAAAVTEVFQFTTAGAVLISRYNAFASTS